MALRLHVVLATVICLTSGHATSAATLQRMQAGEPAAPLDLRDWHRQPHTLAEYRGKVVLVNFWASWCAPCLAEIPALRELGQRMADEPFDILAVNVAEPRRKVKWLVDYLSPHVTILLDADRAAFEAWNASVLPTSYLLDRRGQIRYRVQGPFDWDGQQAVDTIRNLLREPVIDQVNQAARDVH